MSTAAGASVTFGEMAHEREDALQGLLQRAAPAMLEVGSALKSAEAVLAARLIPLLDVPG